MFHHRQTMIALRARQTAVRIAGEILYPTQSPPEMAQPAILVDPVGVDPRAAWEVEWRHRVEDEEHRARWRRRFIMVFVTASLIIILSALMALLLKYG
jgi:hypothetical protein